MSKLSKLNLFLVAVLVLVGFIGNQIVVNAADGVDVISTASITDDPAVFAKTLGEEGTWIVCATTDMTFNQPLVIAGEFHNKGKAENDLYRKLAPYDQNDKHQVTKRYTITAPEFVVKSPNTKFQGGIFVGDVYVEADGFTVSDATIEGNVYFAKAEYKDSFKNEKEGKVTGKTEVNPDIDVITGASITDDPAAFAEALGEDGTWIVCATTDMNFNQPLVIAGEFHNKGKAENDLYRKLAPYDQNDKHQVTKRYTITAPAFVVKSPNAKFQGGIFVGDVYVEANGFIVSDATVEGNIYFAKAEYKDSFKIEKEGKVTGSTEVK